MSHNVYPGPTPPIDTESRGTGRSTTWLLLALVALGAALRLYRLGAQSLWVDELLTVHAANLGGRLGAVDLFRNIQGPLHAAIVHAVSLVSMSETALRAASAVAGVLQIPVAYLLGKEMFGRREGLLAALLVSVSPFAIWYSQELRNYSLLILFSGVSSLLALRLVNARGRQWALYGGATLLALLSNLAAVFLVIAQNLAALPHVLRDARFARRWIATQAVILVLFSPWIWGFANWTAVDGVGERVVVGRTAEPEELLRGETTFSPLAVPYAVYVMGYGYSLGPGAVELHTKSPLDAYRGHAGVVMPAALALAAALLAGVWRLGRKGRRSLPAWLVMAVPFIGASALAMANVKPFNPRYVSVALPVLTVVAAAGVAGLRRAAATVVCAALVLFSGVSLANYYRTPEYSREDVRSAAAYVHEREAPGDVVLVPVVKDVFEFYYEGSAERFLIYPGQAGSDEEVAERLESGLEGARRVWFVNARLWHADPEGRVPAWLDANLSPAGSASFAGVAVDLYERPAVPEVGADDSRGL